MIKKLLLALSVAVLAGVESSASAQGTAFTYQGRLNSSGTPVGGSYDFTFTLFNTNSGGTAIGKPFTNSTTPVSNGLFTVVMDFGPGIFTGTNYWLEIATRTNGAPSFGTLTPRQPITPAPYAVFANAASNLLGNVSLAQLPQSLVTSNDPAGVNLTGTFSGNGASLANVNASSLNGLSAAGFWKTAGNSGTIAGLNFLGTTDGQPLEFHVANQRALVLQAITSNSSEVGIVNLVGGSSVNYLAPGVAGSVIVGGGAINYYTGFFSNSIASDFCFIGGGGANTIQTNAGNSVITGGFQNQILPQSQDSVIGGGDDNQILTDSYYSVIAGGYQNVISNDASSSVIGGGVQNVIGHSADGSFIGGGEGNIIQDDDGQSTIAAGYENNIGINSSGAFIGGGAFNLIASGSSSTTVTGGSGNFIDTSASGSTIGGGFENYIADANCTIAGGTNNYIQPGAYDSVIGGGINNVISQGAFYSTIGGGVNNSVQGAGSTVPGGNGNHAIGVNSFAAGTFAYATNSGSFVLTDQQYTPMNSLVANSFTSRFSNGYRFFTGGSVLFTTGNSGGGQNVGWAPGGGSWVFSSDRNLKDRFKPVDSKAVLEKVSELPITEWSYKGYDQRHIGAMAQDFHALFPLNDNDKGLNDLDLHGVELAAIKGLNQKLNEKDARIEQLEKRLEQLEKRLERRDEKDLLTGN